MKVLFFGQLREIAGTTEESLEMAEGATVESVFERYAARLPRMRELGSSIVVARNQQFAAASSPLSDGDEIAFLPPVSGGSQPALPRFVHEIQDDSGHFFAITRQPIDVHDLKQRVLAGSDGAIVDFEGVVRNNTGGRQTLFLEYEGYEAMAVRIMSDLGRDIAKSHAIGRIAMVHRLGRLEIGEASVVIVVSAPHRRPAFDAALEGINRLKKIVPIWKKEHFADGEVWVDGEWDEAVVQR